MFGRKLCGHQSNIADVGRVLILQRGRVVYFGDNGPTLSEYFGHEQLQVGGNVDQHMIVAAVKSRYQNISRGCSATVFFVASAAVHPINVVHSLLEHREMCA